MSETSHAQPVPGRNDERFDNPLERSDLRDRRDRPDGGVWIVLPGLVALALAT